MDYAELAKQGVSMLTGLLPVLELGGKKVGEKFLEALGEKIGEDSWGKVKDLWGKLRKNKKIKEEADKVLENPEDPDNDLYSHLLVQLVQDKSLAETMRALIKEIPPSVHNEIHSFVQNQLAINHVQESAIATGDSARAIKAEEYNESKTEHHYYGSGSGDGTTTADLYEKSEQRKKYLKGVMKRCNALPMADMGGDEEEITLNDVYVGLNSTTEIEPSNEAKERYLEREKVSLLEAATSTRRMVLLGDPGSGKSSFINHLAVELAGKELTVEAPRENWEAGTLPVITVLREVMESLSQLTLDKMTAKARNQAYLGTLFDYWRVDFSQRPIKAEGMADELDAVLEAGNVVLVFDGLDEVPVDFRPHIRGMITALLADYPEVQRVIVTCRSRSYSGKAEMPGFTSFSIAPLNEDQIREFIKNWYEIRLEKGLISETECKDKVSDLQGAAVEPELSELSENPMLLTTMAIIHQRNHSLPKKRVKLYSLAVDVLSWRWQEKRKGKISNGLETLLKKDDGAALRKILERVAYEAHAKGGEKKYDFERGKLLTLLESKPMLNCDQLAKEFLDYIDHRAGLLIGKGGSEDSRFPQVYSFPHRTFQEYLAGCHLVFGSNNVEREYEQKVKDGDYWYVAAILGVEQLIENRNEKQVLDLIYDLSPSKMGRSQADKRATVWSGKMAALLGKDAILADDRAQGGEQYLTRVIKRLVTVMERAALTAVDRAEAGKALAQLGDPRESVIQAAEMEFIKIPAGEFIMGEKASSAWEEHVCQLDYDYSISRFPVTQAQFEEFVAADGYRQERYWIEAKNLGIWKEGQIKDHEIFGGKWRNSPAQYGVPFNLTNHPVSGVSQFEALAFSRWLNELLPKEVLGEDVVMLPSEAEWEKAARGTEGQKYPWAGEFDAGKANGKDTLIKATSAVGCFAAGKSAYGVEEMAGNVWEWTRSLWGKNPSESEFKYPYALDKAAEREKMDDLETARVLRGGAFLNTSDYLRCAYRDGYDPDLRGGSIGFRLVVSPFTLSDL